MIPGTHDVDAGIPWPHPSPEHIDAPQPSMLTRVADEWIGALDGKRTVRGFGRRGGRWVVRFWVGGESRVATRMDWLGWTRNARKSRSGTGSRPPWEDG